MLQDNVLFTCIRTPTHTHTDQTSLATGQTQQRFDHEMGIELQTMISERMKETTQKRDSMS